jgi:lipopolysaccharide export LptBFGC system permease protein LptF
MMMLCSYFLILFSGLFLTLFFSFILFYSLASIEESLNRSLDQSNVSLIL